MSRDGGARGPGTSPAMIRIAPSILAADFARLGEEIVAADEAGADLFHLDVMDGRFVPNLTFGAPVIAALRSFTRKPFDTHLMIEAPDALIPAFVKAGSDSITVQADACRHLDRTLASIREAGVKAGVALSPAVHESAIAYVLDRLDLVLVMSVNPGFGGQTFVPSALAKLGAVKALIGDRPIAIEVDGGIGPETAGPAAAAGAEILVAGTAIFRGGPTGYRERMTALRTAAETAARSSGR